ncbi:hypothetical protein CDD81_6910 [Ophiocordyceps australis]|uniref:Pentatricopeptide repeat protein n=1 Tax=Ophiocordyceps australis TaxID=1399860 RepID=A0A2C5Y6D1_9HYPO|nr:hypothetical protein CDD81_6910 [Ophiocordyceps australis]
MLLYPRKSDKRATDSDEVEEATDSDEVVDEAQERKTAAIRRRVARHMSRMDDPWHIANQVQIILANGGFDEALMLVQKFSARMQVVVSWNHVIDHLLKQQKIKEAIKLYNDMKKRAQLPNVQTYTILFRGLALSDHPKYAVSVALKHYNILLADKRLSPNSTHLNSCLNACARAEDIESLLLIAQTANDSTRAPTAYTYTIILNALRAHAMTEIKDGFSQKAEYLQKNVIDRANDLWSEVLTKWRHGEIVLDEKLVCSMGRIANFARHDNDKHYVFELLRLTMNMPNFSQEVDSDPYSEEMKFISRPGSKPVAVPMSKSAFYAVPGNMTLSLIIATLTQTKNKTIGLKYWNLMVRHYGIIPDAKNWIRMFYMLRSVKSSGTIAELFSVLPPDFLEVKMFRIALETVPEINDLRLYLRAALVCHLSFRELKMEAGLDKARKAYGKQIMEAINRIWEPYMTAYHGDFEENGETSTVPGPQYNQQREVIALARRMFSALNKLVNEKLVYADLVPKIRSMAAKLNRKIVSFYHDREEDTTLDDDDNDDDPERRAGSGYTRV